MKYHNLGNIQVKKEDFLPDSKSVCPLGSICLAELTAFSSTTVTKTLQNGETSQYVGVRHGRWDEGEIVVCWTLDSC